MAVSLPPQRLYAVMDLYGPIAAVKVTGAQRSALAQQAPPELLEVLHPRSTTTTPPQTIATTRRSSSRWLWPGEEELFAFLY